MAITKTSLSQKAKWQSSAFVIWGPFIGTLIIAITFHSHIMFGDPIRFLKGLITPSIIFPMIGGLFLITPFGYLLGIIPAIIIQLLFQHFFAEKARSNPLNAMHNLWRNVRINAFTLYPYSFHTHSITYIHI